jgi:hypothetical protein
MASETLIKIALQLGKKLGANTSKFLGTKSNVTFHGIRAQGWYAISKEY